MLTYCGGREGVVVKFVWGLSWGDFQLLKNEDMVLRKVVDEDEDEDLECFLREDEVPFIHNLIAKQLHGWHNPSSLDCLHQSAYGDISPHIPRI
jgi:hypothetical protein